MKKSFKKFSSFLLVLPLLLMTLSCSSDDDTNSTNNNGNGGNNGTELHEVEYKISIQNPVLTSISYRNAAGEMVEVTQSLEEMTTWATTIETEAPFTATVQMEYDTQWAISYAMQIFVDGELKHSTSNVAGGSVNPELTYEF